jgi:hypothetical protein
MHNKKNILIPVSYSDFIHKTSVSVIAFYPIANSDDLPEDFQD